MGSDLPNMRKSFQNLPISRNRQLNPRNRQLITRNKQICPLLGIGRFWKLSEWVRKRECACVRACVRTCVRVCVCVCACVYVSHLLVCPFLCLWLPSRSVPSSHQHVCLWLSDYTYSICPVLTPTGPYLALRLRSLSVLCWHQQVCLRLDILSVLCWHQQVCLWLSGYMFCLSYADINKSCLWLATHSICPLLTPTGPSLTLAIYHICPLLTPTGPSLWLPSLFVPCSYQRVCLSDCWPSLVFVPSWHQEVHLPRLLALI